jgi:hypothetical protein
MVDSVLSSVATDKRGILTNLPLRVQNALHLLCLAVIWVCPRIQSMLHAQITIWSFATACCEVPQPRSRRAFRPLAPKNVIIPGKKVAIRDLPTELEY